MMVPFRILEHTADVGFEAFGSTLEEVFANAARALIHIMAEAETIEPREIVEIRAEGSGLPELLVNWLSEILYRQETERRLFRDFEIRSLNDRSISAAARGETLDPARHRIHLEVKAVTYHQLAVRKTPDGWRARVYVDI